jgi:NADPH-dependent glutamate synthase beta subunit-like oxidoreductase/NAD-dependent dihydropyrimidine dehydrogenase PreA subunit
LTRKVAAMAISRIDVEKCIGCGTCSNSCAMDVIRRNCFPESSRELTPCSLACPARVNMRGYIHLLGQGKIDEAISLIREELPLPAVTGHVCFHPCEEGCARKDVDKAVNINGLERYVADYWLNERASPAVQKYDRPVAIVGAGPAGLAAAYVLVRMGHPVTVFDGNTKPGGTLRTGIPDYRLPPPILDAQIDYIRGLGVEFKSNMAFGRDITLERLREMDFDAVLLAMGAQMSRKISLVGADLDGVFWGLDFLKEVKLGGDVAVGKRVVVIGGGNVAIDAAMTALRMGGKIVRIVCLESRDEMPAHKEPMEMAEAEGIHIIVCRGPKKVTGAEGRVTGIEIVPCLSVFDESGRFNPRFDEKKAEWIEADSVILAIGEAMDERVLPKDLLIKAGHIMADPVTLETNLPGVFAAGISVTGPGSVVEAIASGKKAAQSIDRLLRGEDLKEGRDVQQEGVKKHPCEGIEKRQRQEIPLLAADQRKGGFHEIKTGLTDVAARREQRRCMACGSKAYVMYLDDCMTCYTCEKDCPEHAIYVAPEHRPVGVSCWG